MHHKTIGLTKPLTLYVWDESSEYCNICKHWAKYYDKVCKYAKDDSTCFTPTNLLRVTEEEPL